MKCHWMQNMDDVYVKNISTPIQINEWHLVSTMYDVIFGS